MTAPREYVCWTPSEEESPAKVTSTSAIEAAKVHVLRQQAEAIVHSNDWSESHVLVVDYCHGETTWVRVKVTVEAGS